MSEQIFKKELDNYTSIARCRLCQSHSWQTVIDFGRIPLANSYPESKTEIETFYPMSLIKCDDCGHVQLRQTVNPEILFSNYSYASSDSPTLLKHFKEYAATVTSKLGLGEYDSVLEIGSNDGILLKEFVGLGFLSVYGVEPASNMADRSVGKGAVIYNQFFDETLSKKLLASHGKMSLITANNVFAHVAHLESVVKGIIHLLADDGVFVFENAYLLDTIKGMYFDQVYHEHLQYYGVKPLKTFLEKFGLEIFDIERIKTQGGSFRIYSKLKSSSKHPVLPSVQAAVDEEDEYQLYDYQTYADFTKKLVKFVEHMKAFIRLAKVEGKTISCYGCPAKFALFSKVFGLHPDAIEYVVDDSPLKQGKFSPGKKIPIVSREEFIKNPTDYCIVSVWNMKDAIIAKNKQYLGKWIVPLPYFEII